MLARGPLRSASRKRMTHRWAEGGRPFARRLALVPRARPAVQLRLNLRGGRAQACAQHVGEQVMIAIPAPLAVQSNEKQVLARELGRIS
jgi:hypothetical protein